MNGELSSDNNTKLVYQISLSSNTLGLINPYLFVEKLKEKILLKLPNIKVSVTYHTKGETPEHSLVQLKCFSSKNIPVYKVNNIKEEIDFMAATLRSDLDDKIEGNRSSAA